MYRIDSVGTIMLIEISEERFDVVADLYTKSLNTGDIPDK